MFHSVPWERVMLYFWAFRRRFASIEVPESHPRVVVEDEEYEELRRMFRKEHFMVSWPFSYRYESEDMNLVRPEYEDDEYKFYQLHVRAFRVDNYFVFLGHYELDPTDHPSEHIDEVNMDVEKGTEMLKNLLRENGVEFRVDNDIEL